jgi:hypothetical protein
MDMHAILAFGQLSNQRTNWFKAGGKQEQIVKPLRVSFSRFRQAYRQRPAMLGIGLCWEQIRCRIRSRLLPVAAGP